jgi:hypothetical protein
MHASGPISWLINYGSAVAVVLSFFALLVSVFSLGWNVYRDVILKARLRVHLGITIPIHPNGKTGEQFLSLSIVNFGPAPVTCEMPIARTKPFFRRLMSETKVATLIHDYTNPMCAKPPFKLGVGEQAQVTFPIHARCFLDEELFRVGIRDSFGRIHWAPKKDVYRARQNLKEIRQNSTCTL